MEASVTSRHRCAPAIHTHRAPHSCWPAPALIGSPLPLLRHCWLWTVSRREKRSNRFIIAPRIPAPGPALDLFFFRRPASFDNGRKRHKGPEQASCHKRNSFPALLFQQFFISLANFSTALLEHLYTFDRSDSRLSLLEDVI